MSFKQHFEHCTIAGNFRQRKISSKATVGQFVRNLFSLNVGRRSFALWSFSLVKKNSQDFNLVKNCFEEIKRRN